MNYQHKSLAAGRWSQLSLIEQMANIGSEVERALNWQAKNNPVYSQQAFWRALELLDFTLGDLKTFSRLKELARLREAIVDYFFGTNQFKSSQASWRRYFLGFFHAARRSRV
ncbi:MAG: hypothetical protein KKH93_05090 [Candidatus Omnitrophica bacterium]|nr:hypothetical protein [Candidatus Omnitrophota bacterium]MBU2044026.1 hypothetical protein [Candidatus Omnitrophota bacterium]MBU2251149.1 hypothetical protein [Candidatus Omnitrophota bacterium]MBU2473926.1 hypothetical protein [Candidatus Omnitrophota bacterium]